MHTNPKALTKYFIRFQFTAQRLTSNVSGARSRMLLCVLYKKHIFTPIGCVGNWVSLICWWIPLRVLFQDKSRKASHAWLAAGSGGDCDWCGRALTDKPSLYCESEWAKLDLIFIDLECILSWFLNIVVELFCCLLNRRTKLRLWVRLSLGHNVNWSTGLSLNWVSNEFSLREHDSSYSNILTYSLHFQHIFQN